MTRRTGVISPVRRNTVKPTAHFSREDHEDGYLYLEEVTQQSPESRFAQSGKPRLRLWSLYREAVRQGELGANVAFVVFNIVFR